MEKKQIRTIFLFHFKQGRKATESARDINNAFGPGTTNKRTAQWWFQKFRNGDENLEDDERSGRPSDVDNDKLRSLVEINPRSTVRELAAQLDVTYTTISNHLRKIGKSKQLDKWGNQMPMPILYLDRICRTCLIESPIMHKIVDPERQDGLQIKELLISTVPNFNVCLEREGDVPVPWQICHDCLDRLKISYDFQQMCFISNERLKFNFKNPMIKNEEVLSVAPPNKYNNVDHNLQEICKIEINDEHITPVSYGDDEGQRLHNVEEENSTMNKDYLLEPGGGGVVSVKEEPHYYNIEENIDYGNNMDNSMDITSSSSETDDNSERYFNMKTNSNGYIFGKCSDCLNLDQNFDDIHRNQGVMKQKLCSIQEKQTQMFAVLKKILQKNVPVADTKMFPIETMEALERANNHIRLNMENYIQTIRVIISPDGLKKNFDRILGAEITSGCNYDGLNDKKSFKEYNSLNQALFEALKTEGMTHKDYTNLIRECFRIQKHRNFKRKYDAKKKDKANMP